MRLVAQSMYGVVEIVTWFGVCINALGLAYAQEGKENVAITLFTDRRSERTRIALDIAGLLAGVFIAAVSIWGLYRFIGIQIRNQQVSTSLHLPFWPVVAIILAGMATFTVTLITDILRSMEKLKAAGRTA
jgi:TRAP-type C4-dicarboxylate transport system permease small subunit